MTDLALFNALRAGGICPTCYNMEHGGVYAPLGERLLFEDECLQLFLEERPRSKGHAIILCKPHFRDMSEAPEQVLFPLFACARQAMTALKEAYGAERVYLCTMCDGPTNHLHLQLIPRHPGERVGSSNFTRARGEYVHDAAAAERMRALMARPLHLA